MKNQIDQRSDEYEAVDGVGGDDGGGVINAGTTVLEGELSGLSAVGVVLRHNTGARLGAGGCVGADDAEGVEVGGLTVKLKSLTPDLVSNP